MSNLPYTARSTGFRKLPVEHTSPHSRPNKTRAPHGGTARVRRTSVFGSAKNLGAGRIHFARACRITKGNQKKKDIQQDVLLFLERVTRLELAISTPEKLRFSGGPAPLGLENPWLHHGFGGGSKFEPEGVEDKEKPPSYLDEGFRRAPHGGTAQVRRTRVLAPPKPWRRANSLRPSMFNHQR